MPILVFVRMLVKKANLYWINNDGVFMLNCAPAAALCGFTDEYRNRFVLLFSTTFLSFIEGFAVLKGV